MRRENKLSQSVSDQESAGKFALQQFLAGSSLLLFEAMPGCFERNKKPTSLEKRSRRVVGGSVDGHLRGASDRCPR